MCVTNSYTIGSPSTDSSIELVFVPRNEALKCQLTNIVIVTLCIKVFYFFRSEELEHLSGFEPVQNSFVHLIGFEPISHRRS